jgi:hypothetical protein
MKETYTMHEWPGPAATNDPKGWPVCLEGASLDECVEYVHRNSSYSFSLAIEEPPAYALFGDLSGARYRERKPS